MTSLPVGSPNVAGAMDAPPERHPQRGTKRPALTGAPRPPRSQSSAMLLPAHMDVDAQPRPQRIVSQPAMATLAAAQTRPRRSAYQMSKSPRLSASAAGMLDWSSPGPSNMSRISPAASFRFSETERARALVSPEQYRFNYATSPLAPREALRSPSKTPPMNTPDLSRFPSMHASSEQEVSDYDDFLRQSALLDAGADSAALERTRRRKSDLSLMSMRSLSSSVSQGTRMGNLIGSYEESLLSGRMSSMPSKALQFDAELGVLGYGKCKAALRCPPHAHFKFPAHFYTLEGAAAEGKASPSSPYVGTIDLDSYYIDQLIGDQDDVPWADASSSQGREAGAKPSFPGYRVPPKGQIQLIIKNPHLTAVKVFLVPYDVTTMQAGQKTFVRQKCYYTTPSAPGTPAASPELGDGPVGSPPKEGPINGPSLPSSPGGSPPALRPQTQAKDALRYAVHLQFCAVSPTAPKRRRDSPARAMDKNAPPRIYLHKAIRVVFSARIPDKTEKCSITTDTPRLTEAKGGDNLYSTYTGPSEEWLSARKIHKMREAERRLAQMRQAQDEEALFDLHAANSDPNGERDTEATVGVPMERDCTPVYSHVRHLSRNGEEEGDDAHIDIGSGSEALDIPDRSTSLWHRRHIPSPAWTRNQRGAVQESRAGQQIAEDLHRAPSDRSPRTTALQIAGEDAVSPTRMRASTTHLTLRGMEQLRRHGQGERPLASPPLVEHSYDERSLLEQFHSALALRSQQSTPTFGTSAFGVSQARAPSPAHTRLREASPVRAPNGGHRLRAQTSNALPATSGSPMLRASSSHGLPSVPQTAAPSTALSLAHATSRPELREARLTPEPLEKGGRPDLLRQLSSTSSSSASSTPKFQLSTVYGVAFSSASPHSRSLSNRASGEEEQ